MFARTAFSLILFVASLAAAGPVEAATYYVPLDYADIQSAVTAAGEGDTVLVAPGTYTGASNREIDFGGVNIVLMSEDGPQTTIIDCEAAGRAFLLHSEEDSTSVISGFTITNGSGGNGGGISSSHAAPTFENCVISNCVASMNGGGMYFGYCSTRGYVRNCVFYGNSCPFRGGGISLSHGDGDYFPPAIIDCIFYDNTCSQEADYGGGAIFSNVCPSLVTGCTMVENSGGRGAGGLHSVGAGMTVRNSIVAFNSGTAGVYGVYVERCILFSNDGEDNIFGTSPVFLAADPLFCDRGNRDLTLCSNSPCLAGSVDNPWGEHIGALPSGCGDCTSGTEESSWGLIKSRLRK
jgi:parallel beta-helix repeat protein